MSESDTRPTIRITPLLITDVVPAAARALKERGQEEMRRMGVYGIRAHGRTLRQEDQRGRDCGRFHAAQLRELLCRVAKWERARHGKWVASDPPSNVYEALVDCASEWAPVRVVP